MSKNTASDPSSPSTDHCPPPTDFARLATDVHSTDLATLTKSREHLTLAARAPRCCHIRPNGLRCGSPAPRRNSYCFFHHNPPKPSHQKTFPPLRDRHRLPGALNNFRQALPKDAVSRGGSKGPRGQPLP